MLLGALLGPFDMLLRSLVRPFVTVQSCFFFPILSSFPFFPFEDLRYFAALGFPSHLFRDDKSLPLRRRVASERAKLCTGEMDLGG